MSDRTKLLFAIVLDILDFFVGRIPGYGTMFDIVLTGVAIIFWGPVGLIQLWEAAEITDQIDGFVPTLTLIALTRMRRNKKKSARDNAAG